MTAAEFFVVKVKGCVFVPGITPVGLHSLSWQEDAKIPRARILKKSDNEKIESKRKLLEKELSAYFSGTLKTFSVPVDFSGATAFRKKVWGALCKIPHGSTVTYGEVASWINCASARAVGQACGANPVPVVVPCHRVVAACGIGGFSGGLERKKKLLAVEKINEK